MTQTSLSPPFSDFNSTFQVPKMEEFLGKRDYTGAMAVLEFNRHSGQGSEEVLNIKKNPMAQSRQLAAWLFVYDRKDEKYSWTAKSISIGIRQHDPNNYSDTETRALSSPKGRNKRALLLQVDMWLGYCAFHMGDYKRAMLEYEALTHAKTPPKVTAYFRSGYVTWGKCNGILIRKNALFKPIKSYHH